MYVPLSHPSAPRDLMEVIRTTNVNDVEWVGGAWRTIQSESCGSPHFSV